MKILILNPNSNKETHQRLEETARQFYTDIQIDVISVQSAPKLVASYEDQAASAAEMVSIIKESRDKYDAFVLACHADPNLELVKEVAQKPVIGIAQASMSIASQMYGGYAVITPSEKIVSKKYALARKYYCGEQLKTIVVCHEDTLNALKEAALKALKVPGVNSLVLGCANYCGQAGWLENQLGIPVVDGLVWALVLARGAAENQLFNNKLNVFSL